MGCAPREEDKSTKRAKAGSKRENQSVRSLLLCSGAMSNILNGWEEEGATSGEKGPRAVLASTYTRVPIRCTCRSRWGIPRVAGKGRCE